MTKPIWGFAVILLVSGAGNLLAEESAGNTGEVTRLPVVVVEGAAPSPSFTSPPVTAAARELGRVPGGTDLVVPDRFDTGRASNFEEVFQRSPGAFFHSDNGMEAAKVSIRGSGLQSDDPLGVQFLLDGLSYNEGDGEAHLEDFDSSAIKYVEVYRGANALRYGGYTLGGAVNVVPLTGRDFEGVQAAFQAGSFGYLRGDVSAGGVLGSVDGFGVLTTAYQDGFRDHSRENDEKLFADIGQRLASDLETRWYVTLGRVDRQLPTTLTKEDLEQDPTQPGDEAVEQDFGLEWTSVRLANKTTWRWDVSELNAGLFWQYRQLEQRDLFSDDERQGITAFSSNNTGLLLNWTSFVELFGRSNMLTVGLAPAAEVEDSSNYENIDGHRGALTARAVNTGVNVPFYVENQHELTTVLSAVTAVQFVYSRRDFTDEFNSSPEGNQSHIKNYYAVNPKAGLIADFGHDNRGYINVSRSFQPPSFDDLTPFGPETNSSLVFVPLKAQTAWTVEVGTEGQAGRVNWELSLYNSWVENELLALNNASGKSLGTVNASRTIHQGIELGLDVVVLPEVFVKARAGRRSDRVRFSQAYTLNEFRFDGDAVYGNNRLAGIPVHLYEAELMYEHPCGFYAGPNLEWSPMEFPADQANTLFADPYTLLGFRIGWKNDRGLSVYVEGKNLTDQRYASSIEPIADARTLTEPPDIFNPGQGRAFYGGISYRW